MSAAALRAILRVIVSSHEHDTVWFVSVARVLPVVAMTLLLGQAALAQGNGQSSAKLGSPAVAAPARAQPDPGTLFAFSDAIGQVRQFSVVGSRTGSVWGDGVYTSDSVLAAAAVHAGLLAPGESGIVSVEMVEGLDAYEGAERNGVTSLSYGRWNVAYRFIGVAAINATVALPDPGDLSGFRGQNGVVLTFEVTGEASGAVWGDGVYTDDSRLAAAAVHAGLLQPGQTGLVGVEILAGQAAYAGAERNGVSSGAYGNWPGSFRVVPLSGKATSKLSN
ncbi:LCCL domain-containing protein [Devosia sp. Root635]|uniref:LCCL domain-containing protein n=1 Tax=Devosia sp. Root635 TaxID=1736575 RepID=UPI000B2730C2|nr:LCCL domain-containing protein [Devosia sp. Root635]